MSFPFPNGSGPILTNSQKVRLTSDFQLLFALEPISGRQGGGEGSTSACFSTWSNL